MSRLSAFFFIFFAPLFVFALDTPLRGLRVDPSYFYALYPTMNAKEVAQKVIERAQFSQVNTLFLYAYNPSNGAFYSTDYSLTDIEPHWGKQNIFGEIYNLALKNNIKVIAVIAITDFKDAWEANPDWRAKLITGGDYQPMPHVFLLSAWHPEFREWFRGFVKDLVTRFPNLYAVESVEPTIDCYWKMESDYNPEANKAFFERYPHGKLGDKSWRKVRAQGVTELLGIMAETSHAVNIKAGVVQTWPATANGNLFTSERMRDEVGYDLDGILSLKKKQKMDFIVGELLWQQWLGEYGTSVFTPKWTLKAAKKFIALVADRAAAIIHVEISTWHGQHSSVTPNLEEFQQSLAVISKVIPHIDVYDYSQIENRQAWEELLAWK
ncbi:MAG: hypothetical protein J7501_04025 [Bdellovibrio sp.]|nr:hypothetical protein [Bdellovibrio sp.]